MGDIRKTPWTRFRRWLWRWETPFEKAFVFIAGGYVVLMLLAGCTSYAHPYVNPPQETFACVKVNWTELASMQMYCPPNSWACARASLGGMPGSIWTTKPEAFDDYDAVYRLGHEVLHSLGATHK